MFGPMLMRTENFNNRPKYIMQDKRGLGDKGERFVADYLKKNGFVVRSSNYQRRCGEIDLIAQKDTLIVFVEVKMRQEDYFNLSEVVGIAKQRKIIATARYYIAEHQLQETVQRFDVALVHVRNGECDIAYIPNAFTAPDRV